MAVFQSDGLDKDIRSLLFYNLNMNEGRHEINTPIIESATEADVLDIQKVFYETWVSIYQNEEHGITEEDLKKRYANLFSEEVLENRRKIIRELGQDERFLVAKIDGKIVGSSYLEREPDHNRLQSLYILPEYQGRGIGTKFWHEAQDFFDFSKDTVLDVVEYNSKAIEFYKRLGFIDSGKRFAEEMGDSKKIAVRPMMEMVLPGKK